MKLRVALSSLWSRAIYLRKYHSWALTLLLTLYRFSYPLVSWDSRVTAQPGPFWQIYFWDRPEPGLDPDHNADTNKGFIRERYSYERTHSHFFSCKFSN